MVEHLINHALLQRLLVTVAVEHLDIPKFTSIWIVEHLRAAPIVVSDMCLTRKSLKNSTQHTTQQLQQQPLTMIISAHLRL